jgi:hypothetical protein
MRRVALASGLAISASALFLGSMAPACGSSAGPPGSGTGPNGSSSGASSGSSSGASSSGGSSGGSSSGSIGKLPIGDDGGSSSQGDPDASCAGFTAEATATSQPVAMEFVLDGSGSMKQSNKWTAATAALSTIFSDMGTKNDPGLYAGLIVFSDKNDSTGGGGLFGGGGGGPYPGTNDVPIAQVNGTQAGLLQARYGNGDQPSNSTPTGAAMTGGYGVLESFTGAGTNAKKVLILITDGVPTDNCAVTGANYTTNQCVTQAATELTKASPAGPVETFAIGVGAFPSTDLTNYDPSFLGYLANAGGSGPAGCVPSDNATAANLCYFEVDPSGSAAATETAFEAAINAIRGKVVSLSCTFKINPGDAGAIDPTKVNVSVNGQPVPQDPTNGWTYDNPTNPTSVTLHGTSCAEVTNSSGTASVSVELGCAYVKVPPPQ